MTEEQYKTIADTLEAISKKQNTIEEQLSTLTKNHDTFGTFVEQELESLNEQLVQIQFNIAAK